MMPQSVIIHERLDVWARQLRPRLAETPILWSETRSGDDLTRASARSVVPIVLIDLGDQANRRLEDVAIARRSAPDGLILVLDPRPRPGIVDLARELGASHAIAGQASPPEVARLLGRWLPLARRRAQAAGWAPPAGSSDPWDLDSWADLAPKPARHPLAR